MDKSFTEDLYYILKDVELTDINNITFEILMKTAQKLFQHNVYDKTSCEYSFNKGYIKLYHKDRINHNSLEVFNNFDFNNDIVNLNSQTDTSSNSVLIFDIEKRYLYLLLYDKVLDALKPILKIRFKHINQTDTPTIKIKNKALDNFLGKLFFNSVDNTAESNSDYIENILMNEHLNEKLDNNLHAQYLIKRYLDERKQEFVENITDFIEEAYNPDIVDIGKFTALLNESNIENLIGESDSHVHTPSEELSSNMNDDLDVPDNEMKPNIPTYNDNPINSITQSSMTKFFGSNDDNDSPITVVPDISKDNDDITENNNVAELKELQEADKDEEVESEDKSEGVDFKQSLQFP